MRIKDIKESFFWDYGDYIPPVVESHLNSAFADAEVVEEELTEIINQLEEEINDLKARLEDE